jgi:beta-glucosidase-like glycosyl hydrolase
VLYSGQQVVSMTDPFAVFTPYGGIGETERLESLLQDERIRHITLSIVDSPEASARWNNAMQALTESLPWGIPVNISSDLRHTPSTKKMEFNMGAADYISTWPEELELAASFSPELAREFGQVAAREYRTLGIATALSPQIDLATELRWNRFYGTFGESSLLAAAIMPYYSISLDQDTRNHENVGNSYSAYLITDLLRKKYGFDGVVCTDWGITADQGQTIDTIMCGKPWGVAELSIEDRHYKVIMAGVDQFGGNNEIAPLLTAVSTGTARFR